MGEDRHVSPESDAAKQRLKEVMKESTSSTKSMKVKKTPGSPEGRKRTAMMAIAGLVVVGLGLLGFTILSGNSEDPEPTTVAEQVVEEDKVINLSAAVGLSEGTVEKSLDQQEWIEISPADTVTVGEYVRTAADSRTVLVLDDGSALRLDAETEIKLMTSDANGTEVMLESGQVYSRVIPSDTRTYSVATKNELFTAQGTAYTTKTDGEKDELKVFESKVLVDSQELEVDEGNKYDTGDKEKKEIDLDSLSDDEFVKWNKEQDESNDSYKDKLGVLDILDKKEEETPAEPAPSAQETTETVVQPAIALSASSSDSGISLSWNLKNSVSAPDGFKIVYDKASAAPEYKVHTSQYAGTKDRGATVKLTNGASYNFRVCAYRASSSSCDTYSNAVKVTAPEVAVEEVESGALGLSIDGSTVSWTVGGTAPHGFKVLLSSDQNPTYPSNSISFTAQTSANLPEKAAGTYYVRVCKYTADSAISGGCTDYSNEVEYIVE